MDNNAIYYFSPTKNVFGSGSIAVIAQEIASAKYKKVLLITDRFFGKHSLCQDICALIESSQAEPIVWDGVQPNPTDLNVVAATQEFKSRGCDAILSLGGGSAHDCAKAVAIMATNTGRIQDYEGIDQVKIIPAPLFSVNTTAGTAAELTRFSIITDTSRKVKMAIIDWRITPLLAVNDAQTMVSMPPDLTAATGMDALTHAVEAYVSTAANALTNANAAASISLIFKYLPRAYNNGQDLEAREQMAYAQFLAGLAFNNASLGYIHAMAHQLGGFYDLPHGVCNAILLPVISQFNKSAAVEQLAALAQMLQLSHPDQSPDQKAQDFIEALRAMKQELGIPQDLKALGVHPGDFTLMAQNAMKDPCGLTNPVQPSLQQVIELFETAYQSESVPA
ncbi:MAG: iron-containing alcohol dehydrogenase [Bernardetiaceae bacterium]